MAAFLTLYWARKMKMSLETCIIFLAMVFAGMQAGLILKIVLKIFY